MKKISLIVFIVFIGLFILTGSAYAQCRIAYLDLNRVFNEYNKTKDYDKKLTLKKNSYISERDKKIKEFNSLKDKFESLKDKEKESRKAALEAKALALKNYINEKEGGLKKEVDAKRIEVLKEIKDTVGNYAQKNNISAVFISEILIYQDKAIDITDKILTILNTRKQGLAIAKDKIRE